jgi:hypothetical protein
MLTKISADNIEQSIHTLVGFGTRHTLSSQTDPNRGIGAATEWIGRITVEKQTFIQARASAGARGKQQQEGAGDGNSLLHRGAGGAPGLPRQGQLPGRQADQAGKQALRD